LVKPDSLPSQPVEVGRLMEPTTADSQVVSPQIISDH